MDAPISIAATTAGSRGIDFLFASMLDKSRLYRDCFALGLAALMVFLSLAVFTYDPADPVGPPVAPFHFAHSPNPSIYPPHEHPHNVCGHIGALAADALYSWMGLGAYYLLVSGVILAVQLLRRRDIDCPALRM